MKWIREVFFLFIWGILFYLFMGVVCLLSLYFLSIFYWINILIMNLIYYDMYSSMFKSMSNELIVLHV
jgi:hypothetical protein